MAQFANHLSLLLFTVLMTSSPLIEARASKFFTNLFHYNFNTNNKVTTTATESKIPSSEISAEPIQAVAFPPLYPIVGSPDIAPAPFYSFSSSPAPSPDLHIDGISPAPSPDLYNDGISPAPSPDLYNDGISPAPSPIYSDDSGFGLYGHDSEDDFTPVKKTTTTTIVTDIPTQRFRTQSQSYSQYDSEKEPHNYNNNMYRTDKNYYGNNGYSTFNNNGYSNGYSTFNNDNNGYSNGYSNLKNDNNHNGYTMSKNYYGNDNNANSKNYNGYSTQRQGMSDTRFLNKGKYYYDVNNENNYFPNGYESGRQSGNSNGIYYGNHADKSKNEFDSMEEYERQEGYPQNQGGDFP